MSIMRPNRKVDGTPTKCVCGSTEWDLIYIPDVGYQCRLCVIKIRSEVANLRIGCQLTLDFHSGRLWTDDEAKLWEEKTGTREATTKTLCDTIRRLMG